MTANKNPAQNYDIRTFFKSGDLINHSSFGMGIVEEIKRKENGGAFPRRRKGVDTWAIAFI